MQGEPAHPDLAGIRGEELRVRRRPDGEHKGENQASETVSHGDHLRVASPNHSNDAVRRTPVV